MEKKTVKTVYVPVGIRTAQFMKKRLKLYCLNNISWLVKNACKRSSIIQAFITLKLKIYCHVPREFPIADNCYWQCYRQILHAGNSKFYSRRSGL
jgi:hypothetical protein